MFAAVLLLAAGVFFAGIGWGLPSREADRFLFGEGAKAWGAAEIMAAGGGWALDPKHAADADANPITDRSRILSVNETDGQRAEIVLRYRLYSAQPDEMVTFRALARMPKTKGDPRMYQYGGLWIYPVGGLLKLGSVLGLVELRGDLSYYLDRPEAFGRFYVAARGYSAIWGLVGVWAVWRLAQRWSPGSVVVPGVAAALFALMPVVVNAAHEAKPHLAGAVLILLAVLAGTRYVETGARRWWVIAGATCGLAVGMVLSAAVAFVVLPLMTMLRADGWGTRARRAVGAIAVGAAVYCATNPYVPINLVRDPTVVRENLGALAQAKAITGKSSDVGAFTNARRLMRDGATMLVTTVGTVGVIVLLTRREWWAERAGAATPAILLSVPAAIVLVQFVRLTAGKPGEFARFAILPDVLVMLAAVVWVSSLDWGKWVPTIGLGLLVVMAGLQTSSLVAGFLEESWSRETSSRVAAARRLEELRAKGARTIGVVADPAPYGMPPVDLMRWRVVLLPAEGSGTGGEVPDVIVRPVDDYERTGEVPGTVYMREYVRGRWPRLRNRIGWADKSFEVRVTRELAGG